MSQQARVAKEERVAASHALGSQSLRIDEYDDMVAPLHDLHRSISAPMLLPRISNTGSQRGSFTATPAGGSQRLRRSSSRGSDGVPQSPIVGSPQCSQRSNLSGSRITCSSSKAGSLKSFLRRQDVRLRVEEEVKLATVSSKRCLAEFPVNAQTRTEWLQQMLRQARGQEAD